MTDGKQLQDIVHKQKALLADLERETESLLRSGPALENASLKKELARLREDFARNSEALRTLSAQNAELKNALYEQIFSERSHILDAARKKSDAYFQEKTGGSLNRLAQLEKELQNRTAHLYAMLEKYRGDAAADLRRRLDELADGITAAVAEANAAAARASGAFSAHSGEAFARLKEEQLSEETAAAIGKKNNLEAFVGGNLLNKLGILFVILGVIALSRFTFLRLPDTFKGVILFGLSALLLLAGELYGRKRAGVFSLGLTAAGVASLYVSLSVSYFLLHILALYPALLLCLLITAGAFVLSQRQNSQTIAAFALVGGYLPILSADGASLWVTGAMLYFVILNFLSLLISFRKKWRISMFTGFALNLAGTVYLLILRLIPYFEGDAGVSLAAIRLSAVSYVLFAFAVYTLIPVVSCFRTGRPFGWAEVILLGLNTAFSALILYAVLLAVDLSAQSGLSALFFALLYLGLGRFAEKAFVGEKRVMALFYLTGLSFVVLVVPLQFGRQWLSLGWLIQAVLLSAYGILTEEKNFRRAGFAIGAFCLAAFLVYDLVPVFSIGAWSGYGLRRDLFPWKYFALTAGSAVILFALAYKDSLVRLGERVYQHIALLNGWWYCLYLISRLHDFLRQSLQASVYRAEFLAIALAVSLTFLLAALYPHLPFAAGGETKILSVVMSVLAMLFLLFSNAAGRLIRVYDASGLPAEGPSGTETLIAALILTLLCGLAVWAMRNVMLYFILEKGLPAEWLPLGISGFFLILLTQNLVMQFDLAFTSIAISIIYVTAALAWIVFGFVRRYAFMRRFGLGLAFLAVAKLFLIDLRGLAQGSKIITYFSFGLTLLGISFVYQYFSKRLIPKGEADADAD